jgi:hypothetical protein
VEGPPVCSGVCGIADGRREDVEDVEGSNGTADEAGMEGAAESSDGTALAAVEAAVAAIVNGALGLVCVTGGRCFGFGFGPARLEGPGASSGAAICVSGMLPHNSPREFEDTVGRASAGAGKWKVCPAGARTDAKRSCGSVACLGNLFSAG